MNTWTKLINIAYGLIMIITILIVVNMSNSYISKNCNLSNKGYLYPKNYDSPMANMELIDTFNTYDDAKEYIGYTPLKEYSSNNNKYILVSEGINQGDNKVVCYKYSFDTNELFKEKSNYYFSVSMYLTRDGDWFDDIFILDLMTINTEYGQYIPQGNNDISENGDVYYGVWYGDEVKNISFKKGEFDYTLLGKRDGNTNVYFCTYELKDSTDLLQQVIKTDENGHKYYDVKDVANLLGVKCKMTIDWRIVTYIIVTLLLTTIAALVLIKTLKINDIDGVIIKKVLLWILSIALCSIVAVLIRYYIANPRLYFGQYGIAEVIKNITGQSIPNPKNACP